MTRHAGWLTIFLILAACQKPETQTTAATPPGQPAAASASSAVPPVATPAPPIEIPRGTSLEVRLNESLSTARNREGDPFTGVLERPVDIGGREVIPAGAKVAGHVTTSRSSGRMKGRAVIGITLDSLEDNGQSVAIRTSLDSRASAVHKRRDIEMIGGGSGFGALIGAIAGGGKGAAIGAMAGAGAGAGAEAATGKENVEIPAESLFSFRLEETVQLP